MMTTFENRALSRRTLLKSGAFFAAWGAMEATGRGAEQGPKYDGLRSDKWLGKIETVTKVADRKVFTEGPAVDKAGNVFFTNVPASKILRWDVKARRLTVFRESSHQANGLCFDQKGRLLACEGAAGRVTRTDLKTGEIEVLADKYNELPLAPPNDLCLDAKGRVYFTSRPGETDPEKGNVNAVYRSDPDGSLTQVLRWPDIHMPNGIELSPDEKTLYVIESHPDAKRHRDIRAYDVRPDGSLANERVLFNFHPGRSGDGLCIDVEGNLYVAAGLHKTRNTSETLDTRPGIHVITPRGELVAFRETPEDTITNCAFGGEDLRTLYITCGTLLLSLRTQIAGKVATRQRNDQ
jgi:gluconolactonase